MILFLASKWFVPFFLRLFSKVKVTEPLLSGALIICFAFAYFGEYLGIAGIIGSFFAGIAMAQTKFKKEIEEKVEPIANGIFVPFFFVSIGLSVTFEGISNQMGLIVLFSFIALLSKFIGAGIGAKLAGLNMRSSMGVGAGMISRGEVALIIAAMGLDNKLLPVAYYTPMIIVVVVTTLATPPLLKWIFGKRVDE